jgi:hypothetical protein
LAAAISLAASLTPWGPLLRSPFKLFTTWVHECGHAAMTVLLGGSVQSITIEPDTSGLTLSRIPESRLDAALVASSGYLGASVVGCLLLAATRVHRWAHRILQAIGPTPRVARWAALIFAVLAGHAAPVVFISAQCTKRHRYLASSGLSKNMTSSGTSPV